MTNCEHQLDRYCCHSCREVKAGTWRARRRYPFSAFELAFRFRRIYHVQSRRSKDMIAISIVCVLLICLFRLDLDEVSSRS